jgi:tetratricopeptide (TPR) repeat protein
MKQQPAEAVRLAEDATRRFAAVPRGWCLLSVAYMHNKQYEESLAAVRSGLAQDGDTPDLLYALGCCLHEMGDRAGAREALNKMLAGFAKDAAAIYTLGQIDLEEHDELNARRHLERAAFLDFLLIRERFDRLRRAVSAAQATRNDQYFPPAT